MLVKKKRKRESTSLIFKSKHEYFAYSQLVVLASSYFLPHIMEHIISADGINIVRKKGLQVVIGRACLFRAVILVVFSHKDIHSNIIPYPGIVITSG